MSDPLGWTAQGLEAVVGDAVLARDRIAELSKEYNTDKIVVGYPLNMDGSVGARAKITDDFIAELAKVVTCEVVKWDERLTSVHASRTMRETGVSASKNKEKVDILSAMILLQSYLDSKQSGSDSKQSG